MLLPQRSPGPAPGRDELTMKLIIVCFAIYVVGRIACGVIAQLPL